MSSPLSDTRAYLILMDRDDCTTRFSIGLESIALRIFKDAIKSILKIGKDFD